MESSRLSAHRAAFPATLAKPKPINPGLPPAKAVRMTRAVIDLIFAANALAERNLDPGGPSCLDCHRFALGLDADTGGIEHAATCRTGQALAAIAGIGAAAEGDHLDEGAAACAVQLSQSTHERSTSEEDAGERRRGIHPALASGIVLCAFVLGCASDYALDSISDPVSAAEVSMPHCEAVAWQSRNCKAAAVALAQWEWREAGMGAFQGAPMDDGDREGAK